MGVSWLWVQNVSQGFAEWLDKSPGKKNPRQGLGGLRSPRGAGDPANPPQHRAGPCAHGVEPKSMGASSHWATIEWPKVTPGSPGLPRCPVPITPVG